MNVTILLPWFPLLLVAGIGGHLLGRRKGTYFGILCSAMWMALIQATEHRLALLDTASIAFVAVSSFAIVAAGIWSGATVTALSRRESGRDRPAGTSQSESSAGDQNDKPDQSTQESLQVKALATVMRRFDAWLAENARGKGKTDAGGQAWCAFDEFIRNAVHDLCGGTHVRPFRWHRETKELLPLNQSPSASQAADRVENRKVMVQSGSEAARQGVTGFVLATGTPYVRGDELESRWCDRSQTHGPHNTDWCFPVLYEEQMLGIVSVGRLGSEPQKQRGRLEVAAQTISLLWSMVHEAGMRRSSDARDPATGLLARKPFLDAAEATLANCRKENEPAAVCVVAVEGIRNLTDTGNWESAEALMRDCAAELRRKVRADDEIGRFDDSAFVVLLRRVDEGLTELIVSQLVNRLQSICGDEQNWGTTLKVRCGFANAIKADRTLHELLVDALQRCHEAREEERNVRVRTVTRNNVSSGSPA